MIEELVDLWNYSKTFSQVTKQRIFDQLCPIQSAWGKSNNIHWLLCMSAVTVCVLILLVGFKSHIQQYNKTWHAVYASKKNKKIMISTSGGKNRKQINF